MKTMTITAALLTAVLATGCSSTESKNPVPNPGPGAPAPTTAPTDPSPPGTGTATPPVAEVKAPTIDQVAKMMGALHVMWTNQETSCDTIEGERQAKMPDGSIMEKYKVVFSVPGEADNKHDTTATAAMTYSYRLRCKKGGVYSAYSNELAGAPK